MLAFLGQDLAMAAPDGGQTLWGQTLRGLTPSMGMVDESFGQGSRQIVLIQDAHTNLSAQKNIAKIIASSKIRTVFLEGGSGNDSISFLRKYGTPAERLRVAEQYLHKGYIQGPDYLDLTTDKPLRLRGVEDRKLYHESLDAYRALRNERGTMTNYLDKIERTVRALRPAALNPSLAALDEQKEKFDGNFLPALKYFQYLEGQASIRRIPLDLFPNIRALLKLKLDEAAIDFEKAREEAQRPAHEKRTNYEAYLRYVQSAHKINARETLEEKDALETLLFSALAENDDESRFLTAERALTTLRHLFELRLSSAENRDIETHPANYDIARLTGYLNTRIMELKTNYESAVFLEPGYDEAFAAAKRFYALTYERDQVFIEKILNQMNKSGEKSAVLVAGGYHAEHLKELFKQNRLSFVSVVPRVEQETNIERYEKLLLGPQTTDRRQQTRADMLSVLPAHEFVGEDGVRVVRSMGLALKGSGARLASRSEKKALRREAERAEAARVRMRRSAVRAAAVAVLLSVIGAGIFYFISVPPRPGPTAASTSEPFTEAVKNELWRDFTPEPTLASLQKLAELTRDWMAANGFPDTDVMDAYVKAYADAIDEPSETGLGKRIDYASGTVRIIVDPRKTVGRIRSLLAAQDQSVFIEFVAAAFYREAWGYRQSVMNVKNDGRVPDDFEQHYSALQSLTGAKELDAWLLSNRRWITEAMAQSLSGEYFEALKDAELLRTAQNKGLLAWSRASAALAGTGDPALVKIHEEMRSRARMSGKELLTSEIAYVFDMYIGMLERAFRGPGPRDITTRTWLMYSALQNTLFRTTGGKEGLSAALLNGVARGASTLKASDISQAADELYPDVERIVAELRRAAGGARLAGGKVMLLNSFIKSDADYINSALADPEIQAMLARLPANEVIHLYYDSRPGIASQAMRIMPSAADDGFGWSLTEPGSRGIPRPKDKSVHFWRLADDTLRYPSRVDLRGFLRPHLAELDLDHHGENVSDIHDEVVRTVNGNELFDLLHGPFAAAEAKQLVRAMVSRAVILHALAHDWLETARDASEAYYEEIGEEKQVSGMNARLHAALTLSRLWVGAAFDEKRLTQNGRESTLSETAVAKAKYLYQTIPRESLDRLWSIDTERLLQFDAPLQTAAGFFSTFDAYYGAMREAFGARLAERTGLGDAARFLTGAAAGIASSALIFSPSWTDETAQILAFVSYPPAFASLFFIHAFGHAFVGALAGAKTEWGMLRTSLGSFPDDRLLEYRSPWQRIAYLLGGPLTNLAAGSIGYWVYTRASSDLLRIPAEAFGAANFAAAVGTLLPLNANSGGGLILRLTLEQLRKPRGARLSGYRMIQDFLADPANYTPDPSDYTRANLLSILDYGKDPDYMVRSAVTSHLMNAYDIDPTLVHSLKPQIERLLDIDEIRKLQDPDWEVDLGIDVGALLVRTLSGARLADGAHASEYPAHLEQALIDEANQMGYRDGSAEETVRTILNKINAADATVGFTNDGGTQAQMQGEYVKDLMQRIVRTKLERGDKKVLYLLEFGIGYVPGEMLQLIHYASDAIVSAGGKADEWLIHINAFDVKQRNVEAGMQMLEAKSRTEAVRVTGSSYRVNFLNLTEMKNVRASMLSAMGETDLSPDIIFQRHATYSNTHVTWREVLDRYLRGEKAVSASVIEDYLASRNILSVFAKAGSFYVLEPTYDFGEPNPSMEPRFDFPGLSMEPRGSGLFLVHQAPAIPDHDQLKDFFRAMLFSTTSGPAPAFGELKRPDGARLARTAYTGQMLNGREADISEFAEDGILKMRLESPADDPQEKKIFAQKMEIFIRRAGMTPDEFIRRSRLAPRSIKNWLAGISTPFEYPKKLKQLMTELRADMALLNFGKSSDEVMGAALSRKDPKAGRQFGDKVKLIRLGLGLTHKEFGALLGQSHVTSANWEAGEMFPYPAQFKKLSEVSGVSASRLLTGLEEDRLMSLRVSRRSAEGRENFSKKLWVLRLSRGLTVEELAAKIGMSFQALNKWELGVVPGSDKWIRWLSDALGVESALLIPQDSGEARLRSAVAETSSRVEDPQETVENVSFEAIADKAGLTPGRAHWFKSANPDLRHLVEKVRFTVDQRTLISAAKQLYRDGLRITDATAPWSLAVRQCINMSESRFAAAVSDPKLRSYMVRLFMRGNTRGARLAGDELRERIYRHAHYLEGRHIVKLLRQEAGLTQPELGSPLTIRFIEQGRTMPTPRIREQIINKLQAAYRGDPRVSADDIRKSIERGFGRMTRDELIGDLTKMAARRQSGEVFRILREQAVLKQTEMGIEVRSYQNIEGSGAVPRRSTMDRIIRSLQKAYRTDGRLSSVEAREWVLRGLGKKGRDALLLGLNEIVTHGDLGALVLYLREEAALDQSQLGQYKTISGVERSKFNGVRPWVMEKIRKSLIHAYEQDGRLSAREIDEAFDKVRGRRSRERMLADAERAIADHRTGDLVRMFREERGLGQSALGPDQALSNIETGGARHRPSRRVVERVIDGLSAAYAADDRLKPDEVRGFLNRAFGRMPRAELRSQIVDLLRSHLPGAIVRLLRTQGDLPMSSLGDLPRVKAAEENRTLNPKPASVRKFITQLQAAYAAEHSQRLSPEEIASAVILAYEPLRRSQRRKARIAVRSLFEEIINGEPRGTGLIPEGEILGRLSAEGKLLLTPVKEFPVFLDAGRNFAGYQAVLVTASRQKDTLTLVIRLDKKDREPKRKLIRFGPDKMKIEGRGTYRGLTIEIPRLTARWIGTDEPLSQALDMMELRQALKTPQPAESATSGARLATKTTASLVSASRGENDASADALVAGARLAIRAQRPGDIREDSIAPRTLIKADHEGRIQFQLFGVERRLRLPVRWAGHTMTLAPHESGDWMMGARILSDEGRVIAILDTRSSGAASKLIMPIADRPDAAEPAAVSPDAILTRSIDDTASDDGHALFKAKSERLMKKYKIKREALYSLFEPERSKVLDAWLDGVSFPEQPSDLMRLAQGLKSTPSLIVFGKDRTQLMAVRVPRDRSSRGMEFATKLKSYRLDEGLTGKQMAERIGAAEALYRSWELGDKFPSAQFFPAILKAMGVDASLLLFGQSRDSVLARTIYWDDEDGRKEFGNKIWMLRLEKGWDVGTAAAHAGVTQSILSQWEAGAYPKDRSRALAAADGFGVPGSVFAAEDRLRSKLESRLRDLKRRNNDKTQMPEPVSIERLAAHFSVSTDAVRDRFKHDKALAALYREAEMSEPAATVLETFRRLMADNESGQYPVSPITPAILAKRSGYSISAVNRMLRSDPILSKQYVLLTETRARFIQAARDIWLEQRREDLYQPILIRDIAERAGFDAQLSRARPEIHPYFIRTLRQHLLDGNEAWLLNNVVKAKGGVAVTSTAVRDFLLHESRKTGITIRPAVMAEAQRQLLLPDAEDSDETMLFDGLEIVSKKQQQSWNSLRPDEILRELVGLIADEPSAMHQETMINALARWFAEDSRRSAARSPLAQTLDPAAAEIYRRVLARAKGARLASHDEPSAMKETIDEPAQEQGRKIKDRLPSDVLRTRVDELIEKRAGGQLIWLLREQAGLRRQDLGPIPTVRSIEIGKTAAPAPVVIDRIASVLRSAYAADGRIPEAIVASSIHRSFGRLLAGELRSELARLQRDDKPGEIVKLLRRQAGLRLEDFGRPETISRIESGESVPSDETQQLIAQRLSAAFDRDGRLGGSEIKNAIERAFGHLSAAELKAKAEELVRLKDGAGLLKFFREHAGLKQADLGDTDTIRLAETGRTRPGPAVLQRFIDAFRRAFESDGRLTPDEAERLIRAAYGRMDAAELRAALSAHARFLEGRKIVTLLREQADIPKSAVEGVDRVLKIETGEVIPTHVTVSQLIAFFIDAYAQDDRLTGEMIRQALESGFGRLSADELLADVRKLQARHKGPEIVVLLREQLRMTQTGFLPHRDLHAIESGKRRPTYEHLTELLDRFSSEYEKDGRLTREQVRKALWEGFGRLTREQMLERVGHLKKTRQGPSLLLLLRSELDMPRKDLSRGSLQSIETGQTQAMQKSTLNRIIQRLGRAYSKDGRLTTAEVREALEAAFGKMTREELLAQARELADAGKGAKVLMLLRKQAGLRQDEVGPLSSISQIERGGWIPSFANLQRPIESLQKAYSIDRRLRPDEVRELIEDGFGKLSQEKLLERLHRMTSAGRSGAVIELLRTQAGLAKSALGVDELTVKNIESERVLKPRKGVLERMADALQKAYGTETPLRLSAPMINDIIRGAFAVTRSLLTNEQATNGLPASDSPEGRRIIIEAVHDFLDRGNLSELEQRLMQRLSDVPTRMRAFDLLTDPNYDGTLGARLASADDEKLLALGFEHLADDASLIRARDGYEAPILTYTLVAIPHGKTPSNVGLLFQGNIDDVENWLTEEGKDAARKGAEDFWRRYGGELLKDPSRFVFVRSPLKRTQQTFEIYAEYLKTKGITIEAVVDPMTIEIDHTRWHNHSAEMLPDGEREKGLAYRRGDFFVKPEGGESRLDLMVRAREWMLAQNEKYAGKTVVQFGHGTFQNAEETILRTYGDLAPKEVFSRTNNPRLRRGFVHVLQESKITPSLLKRMKSRGEKITMLTAYDEADARLLDEAGIELALVGDSYGMVRLGHPDTTRVTMDDMTGAVAQVRKGNRRALIIGDMPFEPKYAATPEEAVKNARLLIAAGADAVKLEGGVEKAPILKAIVDAGIPVMGHIGYTPQTDQSHIIKGHNEAAAQSLLADARAVESAGAFAMVIELTDRSVASYISKSVSIPTIGIGAGPGTDGQVLVIDDLLGRIDYSSKAIYPKGRPRFIGEWNNSGSLVDTVRAFRKKVKEGEFPGEAQSYKRYSGNALGVRLAKTGPDAGGRASEYTWSDLAGEGYSYTVDRFDINDHYHYLLVRLKRYGIPVDGADVRLGVYPNVPLVVIENFIPRFPMPFTPEEKVGRGRALLRRLLEKGFRGYAVASNAGGQFRSSFARMTELEPEISPSADPLYAQPAGERFRRFVDGLRPGTMDSRTFEELKEFLTGYVTAFGGVPSTGARLANDERRLIRLASRYLGERYQSLSSALAALRKLALPKGFGSAELSELSRVYRLSASLDRLFRQPGSRGWMGVRLMQLWIESAVMTQASKKNADKQFLGRWMRVKLAATRDPRQKTEMLQALYDQIQRRLTDPGSIEMIRPQLKRIILNSNEPKLIVAALRVYLLPFTIPHTQKDDRMLRPAKRPKDHWILLDRMKSIAPRLESFIEPAGGSVATSDLRRESLSALALMAFWEQHRLGLTRKMLTDLADRSPSDQARENVYQKTLVRYVMHGGPSEEGTSPIQWVGTDSSEWRRHLPTLSTILSDRGKTRRFLEVLAAIRLTAPYNMNVPKDLEPMPPIAHAEYIGIGLPFEEFTVASVSESYRRHILYIPDGHEGASYALEIKIPGQLFVRNLIRKEHVTVADEMRTKYGSDAGVVKPLFFGGLSGRVGLYGSSHVYGRGSEAQLGFVGFEYEEGHRLQNILKADLRSTELLKRNSVGGRTLEQFYEQIAVDVLVTAIRLHELGYSGWTKRGNDMHLENFRVLQDGRVVSVADFGAFEKPAQGLTERQRKREISGLTRSTPQLIKEGFVGLVTLVPGLKKGGMVSDGFLDAILERVLYSETNAELREAMVGRVLRSLDQSEETVRRMQARWAMSRPESPVSALPETAPAAVGARLAADGVLSADIVYRNSEPLHNRPSAEVALTAREFEELDISVEKKGETADAKNVLQLILLTITRNDRLRVSVKIKDGANDRGRSREALDAIVTLLTGTGVFDETRRSIIVEWKDKAAFDKAMEAVEMRGILANGLAATGPALTLAVSRDGLAVNIVDQDGLRGSLASAVGRGPVTLELIASGAFGPDRRKQLVWLEEALTGNGARLAEGKAGRPSFIPDELEKNKDRIAGLNVSQVADELGTFSRQGLAWHLKNHPEDYGKYQIIKKRSGRPASGPTGSRLSGEDIRGFLESVSNVLQPKAFAGARLALYDRQSDRSEIYEMTVDGNILTARAEGIEPIVIDLKAAKERIRSGEEKAATILVGDKEVVITQSDYKLLYVSAAGKARADLGKVAQDRNKTAVGVFNLDLINNHSFAAYLDLVLAAMEVKHGKDRTAFYTFMGPQHLIDRAAAVLRDSPREGVFIDAPSELKEAASFKLSTPEDNSGRSLPMQKLEEGDMALVGVLLELLIVTARMDLSNISDDYANAYSTLAGQRTDAATLQEITQPNGNIALRTLHSLKRLTKVPVSQLLRIIRLTKQLIAQSA